MDRIHGYILLLAYVLSSLEERTGKGLAVLKLRVEGGGGRAVLAMTALELGLQVVLVERMTARGRCAAGRTGVDCAANRYGGARLRAVVSGGHGSFHAVVM